MKKQQPKDLMTVINAAGNSSETTSPASCRPTTPSPTSQAAIRLARQFPGGAAEVMVKFNPDNQVTFARDPERCHFGMAPSLALVGNAYGLNTALSWLQIQLNDLSEFAGCRNKLSLRQVRELAAIVLEEYGHYRLTEIMLFCQYFKRCHYGRFYGAVDPMVIMQALGTFDDERTEAFDARRSREERRRRDEDDARLDALRRRYIDRIPAAFTDDAPVSFLQYRLMGFDRMDDARLADELDAITSGRKTIPRTAMAILAAAA